MDGGKARLLKLRENPAVQMMGIMDEDGNIDIDRLYNAARMRVDGKKIPWDIPAYCFSSRRFTSLARHTKVTTQPVIPGINTSGRR